MTTATQSNSTKDSEPVDSKPTLKELHDSLDCLLILYLHDLDAYTSAQKLIQKHMSAGFLSLAKANFHSGNGVRKYGQDYYHERAIATRRVVVCATNGESKSAVNIVQWSAQTSEAEGESEAPVKAAETGETEEDVSQLPLPPGTPKPGRESNDVANTSEKILRRTPLESDPLKWFGILVPPALRSSQGSFCAAVNEAIADAMNSAKDMRGTESEIRKLRKDIRRAEKESAVSHG